MDPAGFEPASATVTECCVPLTLRALRAVFLGWHKIASPCVTILVYEFQTGNTEGLTAFGQGIYDHCFFGSVPAAVPVPSLKVWIVSTDSPSKVSSRPLGQRTVTESILVAAPSPKCTRMSLLEM